MRLTLTLTRNLTLTLTLSLALAPTLPPTLTLTRAAQGARAVCQPGVARLPTVSALVQQEQLVRRSGAHMSYPYP